MPTRVESIAITILLGITPLILIPFTKEIFEFPKTNFLYFITGILLILPIWHLNASPLLIFKNKNRNLFIGSIYLLIITNLVSFLFSIDKYTSLFGYYTRFNGGLVSLFCILIWGLYLLSLKFNKKDLGFYLKVILISGLVVSIYGILQKLGIDNEIWKENASKRIFSTFGQPNWLAAYLIPVFFIALYFGQKLQKNIIMKLLPTAIVYIALIFTYSLSGLIAFLISFTIYLYFFRNQIKPLIKKYWLIIPTFLIISAFLAIPFRHRIYEQIENMQNIIVLLKSGESNNISPQYGDTGKIRLILWDGTINLITSSPKQFLIGSGPETFTYAFTRYRPDAINATSEANFIHNKPHNWYLEIFSNLGLLGFISIIIFISTSIYIFAKQPKTNIQIALFCGWISILITNFFGWPTLYLSLLFFILPIFFNYETLKPPNNKPINISFLKTIPFFIVGNLLIFSSIIMVSADYFYAKENYYKAKLLNPFEPRYELFNLIYINPVDLNKIENFYYENKRNPYVVKTLVQYIEFIKETNPNNKGIKSLEKEILIDAAKNSPADRQFKKL